MSHLYINDVLLYKQWFVIMVVSIKILIVPDVCRIMHLYYGEAFEMTERLLYHELLIIER